METAVLIGPKHTGKTSVGRALAGLLDVPFIDLDEAVTARTGKTPRALYREGPEVFRAAETEALRSLLEETAGRRVIAAGGGTADNAAASALLVNTAGVRLLYIEVSEETAWERIQLAAGRTGELPPFLNTANPRETHRALYTRRAAACRALAHITAAGENAAPEAIAQRLLTML
ncbi:MAG: shikimate kinase [Treponema sp.]|jgi:shikimate kinase|nr:shikimate kinase [Treponema sp.]